MTSTRPVAVQDLTCEEIHAGFDALIKRNAELTAERDVAFEMASRATKDLARARRESDARLKIRDVQIDSLHTGIDGRNAEIRQLTARIRELALMNEDTQRQLETAQQDPEAPTPRRRFLKRAGSRKDHP